MSREGNDHASDLKVLHAMNGHFQNVLSYWTYRMRSKSQLNSGTMVARTSRYSKRNGTPRKAYKFNGKNSITILSILAQFKRACHANEILEVIALRIVSTFIKKQTIVHPNVLHDSLQW